VAKKTNKEVVPVAEILKTGLVALATADGPRRLIGSGDHPAVFDSKTGKEAAKLAQSEAEPLVMVAGAAKKAAATLTAAGVLLVADAIPEDRVGTLAGEVLEPLTPSERIAFLERVIEKAPATRASLLALHEIAAAEELAERTARAERDAKRHAAEVASIAAAEKWVAITRQRHAAEVADLKARLAWYGVSVSQPDSEAAPTLPIANTVRERRPEPESHEDLSFRRDVATQLASSWRETWNPDRPDVRDFLESAMWNVSGLKLIGEAGESTAFDGRLHVCDAAISTGDSVRVVRPGWILQEGEDAEHVVLKAVVEPQR
jgi:hypothetical protein